MCTRKGLAGHTTSKIHLQAVPIPGTPVPGTPCPGTPMFATPRTQLGALPRTPMPGTPMFANPRTPAPKTPMPGTPICSTPIRMSGPGTPMPATPMLRQIVADLGVTPKFPGWSLCKYLPSMVANAVFFEVKVERASGEWISKLGKKQKPKRKSDSLLAKRDKMTRGQDRRHQWLSG